MTDPRLRARAGLTLMELLVVLALLAVLYSIVSVSTPVGAGDPGEMSRALLETRRSAILEGRTVSRSWRKDGRQLQVTAFPSGLVLADTGRGTFLVTEEPSDAKR